MTTARERFEKWLERQDGATKVVMMRSSVVVQQALVKAVELTERQFWPPRPTPEALAAAGVEIVGDSPVMVPAGATLPENIITENSWWGPTGTLVNESNHSCAPIFVWECRKVKK
jgi:hypothetical protein